MMGATVLPPLPRPAPLGLLTLVPWSLAVASAAGAPAAAAPVGTAQAATAPVAALTETIAWTEAALTDLMASQGCRTSTPLTAAGGQRALSRWEAAALLQTCLQQRAPVTGDLRQLQNELAAELAVLQGQLGNGQARVRALEAAAFSTTTSLSGQVSFVLGANGFNGSAAGLVQQNRQAFGAASFGYDLQLIADTSFNGKDLLRTTLRAGNLTSSSFGGAGPSNLSTLAAAFQENCGFNVSNCGNALAIDRVFYQFPLGAGFTATIGGRVEQDDMLALWPSVYPAEAVLDLFTLAGAPAAYSENLGAGVGLWWAQRGFSISANYVAASGNAGNAGQGGFGTANASATGTVQVGYGHKAWAVAAVYTRLQNTNGLIGAASPFTTASLSVPGNTEAFGLSGYWQPKRAGWWPSISAGWGLNSTTYSSRGLSSSGLNSSGLSSSGLSSSGVGGSSGLVATSQSWAVGLQWSDVLGKGNVLGMAVGQPIVATRLTDGSDGQDSNLVAEWWYRLQVSDSIAVTPALFLLSRPLGADTPTGAQFRQFGALITTSFQF